MEKSLGQAIWETKVHVDKQMDAAEECLLSEERNEQIQLMKQLLSAIRQLDSVFFMVNYSNDCPVFT